MKIDDTVYMVCVDNLGGFVVPAKIIEVQDIYYDPQNPQEPSVWKRSEEPHV